MDALLELLKFADESPEEFDEYVYSIADTIPDTYSILKDQPFQRKEELIAGYKVSYGYRMAIEKLKDEGQRFHAEISVYTIFNFLGKSFINDNKILQEVKHEIANKIERNAV